jgi:hypothetical protein
MTRGTINVKLRPIKLAFLVNPKDKESLLKAIEINTFLWGGMYNPIIPTYKQISSKWKEHLFESPSAKSVVSGYLDNFDPDYVVPMGECVDYNLDIGSRQKIENASQILETAHQYRITSYGIDLFEILNYFFQEELKFQRRYPLDICIPRFNTHFRPFLASVFGKLPENFDEIFWRSFAKTLEAKGVDCSASNYVEFFDGQKLFFTRMTALFLKSNIRRPKRCIFLLDATKPLDIMDYWNLRSIGWNILPIPKQFAQSDTVKHSTLDFVEKNYIPDHLNPEIYQYTTILKSRSVSEDEHRNFCNFFEKAKVKSQIFYPRVWNRSTVFQDEVKCLEIEADTTEHDISISTGEIRFKALDPKFIKRGTLPVPRFANEIELKFDRGNALFAEVIPEGGWELNKDLGGFQISEWRVSRKGLVYLSRHSRSTVSLPSPQAEAIFTKWFESKGWTVELSPPGRIAKQMILQLGASDGTGNLARKGIIQLLSEINSSGESIMLEEELRSRISKIANQSEYKIKDLANKILQQLTKAKVIQLGLKVQCPVCTQHSSYSVSSADYKLQCPKCLDQFSFPSASKKVKWAYRTLGPFSTTNQAHGAYTVILTLRFFFVFLLLGGATTPLMSFTAQKEEVKLEADLALFFKVPGLVNSNRELIFAECKTFNDFEKKDVERMIDLGEAFPNAVLVFATLKEDLSDKEKKLLLPMVKKSRKNWTKSNTLNSVLILTGTELFWQSGLSEWRQKMEEKIEGSPPSVLKTELLLLCYFTQQIYLDMDPWNQ